MDDFDLDFVAKWYIDRRIKRQEGRKEGQF